MKEFKNSNTIIYMEELIVKTWRELVFINPELTTYEVLNKVQEKLNISYSEVVGALSKAVDKDLILTKLDANEIIGINKLAISNLEKDKTKMSFTESTLSLMKFLNNIYDKKTEENKNPRKKNEELKRVINEGEYLKDSITKYDFMLNEVAEKISLNDLKEKALTNLNPQEYKIFTDLLQKLIDGRMK